jgi:hypothetical protein
LSCSSTSPLVVGFSAVSTQTALLLDKGHWSARPLASSFGVFAISWAWVNNAWLASAYDNDNAFFRTPTLIEMIGVLVIALGMPPFFLSIDEGRHADNAIKVSEYVIMRVAAVALWPRAAAAPQRGHRRPLRARDDGAPRLLRHGACLTESHGGTRTLRAPAQPDGEVTHSSSLE